MWISELSDRSGVPLATIKYYLREGLLPPGEQVSATRARYDESHVRQLRLVRALVGIGGLSIARVRAVLEAVADDSLTMHDVLGAAHGALVPSAGLVSDESRARVVRLLRQRKWHVHGKSPDQNLLAAALDAIDRVGHPIDDRLLSVYAGAADSVAAAEVAGLDAKDRASAVEQAVVFTALGGPVLLALRRLAQQSASAQRYG